MPDNRFFVRRGPFTLQELADKTGCRLSRDNAGQVSVSDVSPLETAKASDLSFLDNRKYRDAFKATKAGACFATGEMAEHAPSGTVVLITSNPYKAYARAAQVFYPEPWPKAGISSKAFTGEGCVIQQESVIEDGVIIGAGATIGRGCWIEANVVIGPGVVLGDHCRIGSNSTVSHALIGNNVRIYPGCHIGQDGFGFAIDPAGHVKVPQLGRVIIEDDVEIGSGTCIDRGSGPDTIIGRGAWIDNLVQIAHNVKIGRGCIIAGQCGISGSTTLEDFVILAGQVGVAGHLTIGKGTRIAAKSGIISDVAAGQEFMGYPAQPIKHFLRQIALLKRLAKKDKSDG
jgi:UDP-3-O-[3-hydroxymyristoyl] glucosamine N-acyltransferase